MGRMHRVPLTVFMKQLLEAELRLSPHPRGDVIFAAKQAGKHISTQTLAKYLHSTQLSGKLVAHGLRSMARSWMADQEISLKSLKHAFHMLLALLYRGPTKEATFSQHAF